eukprot:scaffold18470_cov29-Tisochrysis_lutea.AAC.4
MTVSCRASCAECESENCHDGSPHCASWAQQGRALLLSHHPPSRRKGIREHPDGSSPFHAIG